MMWLRMGFLYSFAVKLSTSKGFAQILISHWLFIRFSAFALTNIQIKFFLFFVELVASKSYLFKLGYGDTTI